jgi:hypothetical protein
MCQVNNVTLNGSDDSEKRGADSLDLRTEEILSLHSEKETKLSQMERNASSGSDNRTLNRP